MCGQDLKLIEMGNMHVYIQPIKSVKIAAINNRGGVKTFYLFWQKYCEVK